MLNLVVAILIFGCIILVHEFGHFLFAKLNGIGVVEFSVGMGPRIYSFEKGGTRYSLRCLPYGGSCAMIGEDTGDYQTQSFQNKSILSRFSVIAAGPAFNIIFAFLAAMVLVLQIGHDGTVLTGVMEGYPAQAAGLQAGDKIVAINRRSVDAQRDITLYLMSHPGESVTLTYERPEGGSWEKGTSYEKRTTELTPLYDEEYQSYMLGVIFHGYEKVHGPAELLGSSLYEIKYCISATIDSIAMLFHRQIRADEAVAGPVQIVSMVGESVGESREFGIHAIIFVIANWILLLSTSLGMMNLLPFPGLDGCRLMFMLIEVIRGKRIDPVKEGMIHLTGMAVLMALMLVILLNDIHKLL